MTYYDTYDPEVDGTLEVRKIGDSKVNVLFAPPDRSLEEAGLPTNIRHNYRTKILELKNCGKQLTIIPIETFGDRENFLKSKYKKVKKITIEKLRGEFIAISSSVSTEEVLETLEKLPSGFIRNYKFGLGFNNDYRFIVEAVEKISSCTEIFITKRHETKISPDGKTFYISDKDYDDIRRMLNRIRSHAQTAVLEVRYSSTYNFLAQHIGADTIEPNFGKHPHRKLFTAAAEGKMRLKENEGIELIESVSKHAPEIAESSPSKIVKLRSDLEQVTLKKLIKEYKNMLKGNKDESHWQEFFNENPFIFNMAFNCPVVVVGGQMYVGGMKSSRTGAKIADFVVRNSLTNNVALVEIKTPRSSLISNRTASRGVYLPSSKTIHAVAQVLNQKANFEADIYSFKAKNECQNIQSYAVRCCVVIGKIPKDQEKVNSFEMYRKNLINVEVITYSEILDNMKQLSRLLNNR